MSECNGIKYIFNTEYRFSEDFDDNMLLQGKSIYEVIRVKNGIPLFIEKHTERLQNTARLEKVQLFVPIFRIRDFIYQLIRINNQNNGQVKIVYSFYNDYFGQVQNHFICYFLKNSTPMPDDYKYGVKVLTCNVERKNPNAKVVNYSQRSWLTKMILDKQVHEILLIDKNGNITEGSRSNFFAIKDKFLFTPPVTSILPGVTRRNIIDLCSENNIKIIEASIKFDKLASFDAVFITGTSRKILPIQSIDELKFQVDNPLLRDLMEKFDQLIDNYLKSQIITKKLD